MDDALPMQHDAGADDALVAGVRAADRRALARAITLVESTRADHRSRAQQLLERLLPHTGGSYRIGLSGVPGVGKSTFIEAFGMHLIERGMRVAVLAVDPSSARSGGSILGDKTRMQRLSTHERAFIRPSPTGGSLGGVAQRTREALLCCEAAGFDVVIVETVGVGQSETAVAGMTDVFALLQLPNAGDELQGIKRGIMELADLVAVNKADIDPLAAQRAQQQLRAALSLLQRPSPNWTPPVLLVSALDGKGMEAWWQALEAYRSAMSKGGEWQSKRRQQGLTWMWELIKGELETQFRNHPAVAHELPDASAAVESGIKTPAVAARRLLRLMHD